MQSMHQYHHAARGGLHCVRAPVTLSQRPRLVMARAQRPKTNVVEMLILLEARANASAEDTQAMVEQLWSQQYCSPGVITASGGPLSHPPPPQSRVPPDPWQSPPASPTKDAARTLATAGFTHCVHFRFSNVAQAQAFLRQPLLKSMLTVPTHQHSHRSLDSDDCVEDPLGPICTRTAVMAFQGAVAADMETLFRRGPDFEQGHELVMVLRNPTATTAPAASTPQGATSSASTSASATAATGEAGSKVQLASPAGALATSMQETDKWASELALLAQSSVAGAVQVSHGPAVVLLPPTPPAAAASSEAISSATELTDLTHALQPAMQAGSAGGGGDSGAVSASAGGVTQAPVYVLMARFPSREQLNAFRQSTPCVALWEQRWQLEREASGKVPPMLPLCADSELVMHVNNAL